LKPTVRLTAALAVTVTICLLWAGLGGSHRPRASSASGNDAALPAAPAPALTIGRPEPLRSSGFLSRWTSLRTTALARVRPAGSARVVAELRPTTPEGTANVLAVLRARPDAAGALWVKVRLPVLPNGRVGWVRRQVLGAYQTANTHFVVDRRGLRATLYRNGKAVFTAPVGVGTASWPTPAGEFLVRSKLTRYASPFYGPVAFGTSARSAVLTDWPAGGFVGIHGTSEPQLLPGRVSHGCIRMRNPDIVRLAELMPVGTPLTIR
jgi:lipoprotein-anchoring transpeptidase ErfK/SrfK